MLPPSNLSHPHSPPLGQTEGQDDVPIDRSKHQLYGDSDRIKRACEPPGDGTAEGTRKRKRACSAEPPGGTLELPW